MDALQRLGGGSRNLLAGRDVAGQRHEADVGMLDDPGADRLAVAGDDVEDAGREDLLRQLGEAERRERRLLGRLQHLDVARRERGRELPDRPSSAGSSRARSRRRCRAARGGSWTCSRACTRRSRPRACAPRRRRSGCCRRRPAARRARRRSACPCSATRAGPAPRRSRRCRSASLSSISARSPGVVSSHSGNAFVAASTARSTSASVPRGTWAIVSPVAGLSTSIVPPSTASTHSPPTKFS